MAKSSLYSISLVGIETTKLSLSNNEEKNKELLAQYPSLEKHDLYVLRPNLSPYIVKQLEELFQKMGYTSEDLQKDNMEKNRITCDSFFVFSKN